MAVATLNEPSKSVHSATFFVALETLLGQLKLRNPVTSAGIIIKIEVTHNIVRIEVELLDTEWSRYFTLVIDLTCIK